MAKTMRNIVITCILLIVLAGAACALVVTGGCSATANNPLAALLPANVQTDATNALIDASGIKDHIETELRSRADEIAEQTGIPVSVLDYGIDTLDIQNWEATEKPTADEATATGTYSFDADGTPVDITTYDDTSVVTVSAYGQELTLAVPESAQQYVYLIPLAEALQ